MSASTGLETHAIHFTLRFVQGYRYLDRCGECLVRLEQNLAEGWIPHEPTPASGTLRNDTLGMIAQFNAEALSVQQMEFVSFEHFREQVCRLYETLWPILELDRVLTPVLRAVLQKGFGDSEQAEAETYLRSLALCSPNPVLLSLMSGQPGPIQMTIVTEEDLSWADTPVHQRRRIHGSVVLQEKTPPFDDRLLKRVRTLPQNQQAAMAGLASLRKQHRGSARIAAQIDGEHSFESEFDAHRFDLPAFLDHGWDWLERVRREVPRLKGV